LIHLVGPIFLYHNTKVLGFWYNAEPHNDIIECQLLRVDW